MKTYRVRAFLMAAGLFLAAASPAAAQTITGRVLDDGTAEPLEGVRVVLTDEEGQDYGETFTDATGWFSLAVPRAGDWQVAADLIGYGSVESDALSVQSGERVLVEVRLAVEAVAVGRVVVTSRVASMNPDIQAFYDRVERGRLSGIGRFVTRTEVEASTPSEPSDLLRTMPGVRVVRRDRRIGSGSAIEMAGGCTPAIYVDGTQINRFSGIADDLDDFVSANAIEGIEVYRGAGSQVGRYHDDRGCGLILVWTRRGSNDGTPFTWSRFLVGAGLVLGILLLR